MKHVKEDYIPYLKDCLSGHIEGHSPLVGIIGLREVVLGTEEEN